MPKPEVQLPDPEVPAVDLASALLGSVGEVDVTVGVALPQGWTRSGSPPHVKVSCDGFPAAAWPIYADATLRFVTYAASTTEAKRIAHLLQGLLIAHGAPGGFSRIRRLVGPQPARDDDTGAELAWFTVRGTVRTIPIVPAGS